MPFDFHGQGRLLKKKGLSLNRMSRMSIPGRKLDKNLIMRLADCSYIDRADGSYVKEMNKIEKKDVFIMDRLINSSHKIALQGESMRKKM